MPSREWSAIVESTAQPALVLDSNGLILGWNAAAENLTGRRAEEVVGKPCCEVVAGADVFGNRFCVEDCVLRRMTERREPIHDFQMDVPGARGRAVRVGVSVLALPDPRLSRVIVHLLHPAEAEVGSTPAPKPPRQKVQLTERQLEILRLLADGVTTDQTAAALFISATTVRTHVQHILRKLGAHSKLQAVAIARKNDLL